MNALTLELITLFVGSAVVIVGFTVTLAIFLMAYEDWRGGGMTDQCRYCTLRGDIKKCKATECYHHENWYAIQQQSEIDQLKQQRDELADKVIDLESEIEARDKRTDIDYHRNSVIRELLYLCDEEIAQLPPGEDFGIEHLARAVNKLKYVELPDYKKQRDELLAALIDFRHEMKFKHAIDEANIIGASSRVVLDRVDAAIKNAEGDK